MNQPAYSTANTKTAIEPETCRYCGQELVYQEGTGHMPHAHKPLVTNKAGEPYVVAWSDHYLALVFHPTDIEHYGVLVSEAGDMTCRGKSDGSRCWPYWNTATCVHCDATEANIDAGERPSLPGAQVLVKRPYTKPYVAPDSHQALIPLPTEGAKPARKGKPGLEELYETPLTKSEVHRAGYYAGPGGFGK